jgi:lactoylglutathione lyase
MQRSPRFLPSYLAVAVLCGFAAPEFAAAEEAEFTRQTIDIGVVVSDIEKSLKFYVDGIGFQKAGGFEVAQVGKDAGLTDGAPLSINVLTLGKDKTATKLKLMQVKGRDAKKSDQSTIHATVGFSYITVWVADQTAALARLKKLGLAPLAKGPVPLPGSPLYLTVVKDPDGNFVELVGPKK